MQNTTGPFYHVYAFVDPYSDGVSNVYWNLSATFVDDTSIPGQALTVARASIDPDMGVYAGGKVIEETVNTVEIDGVGTVLAPSTYTDVTTPDD